jgi:mannitol-1-phosphate/altronate dehydrogenase
LPAKPQPLNARTLKRWIDQVALPGYDRDVVTSGVVHVGVGGFHRAHQAMYHDELMNQGAGSEWGICGVGVMPADRLMKEVLAAQDGLYTLVVKHSDGTYEPRIIGSIVEYLFAPEDPEAVIEKMAAPGTRIVSLTVTEGGYNLSDVTVARLCAESSDRIPKWLLPVIREQLAAGGQISRSAAVVASWARYAEGVDEQGQPIEVIDRLRDSLVPLARRQHQDPDAFIANRDVFGDLAEQKPFVAAYRSALASLHQRGARATLESLARRPPRKE